MGTNTSTIADFKLSPEAMVMVAGSNKGTQTKYYSEGYWIGYPIESIS